MTVAKTTKPKPISAHPLFPAVVALWFGALFGLGSLALGADTLERAVLALRFDTVMSALAPPLGIASRLVLALMMTAAGGALGFTLGRAFARGRSAPEPQAAEPQVQAPLVRRRALTASESDSLDLLYDAAPLPGLGRPQFFDITTLEPAEPEPEPVLEEAFESTPVEEIAEEAIQPATEVASEPVAPPVEPADARAVLAGDPTALGTVQLAERLALALQDRRDRRVAALAEQGEAEFTLTAPPLPDLRFGFEPLDFSTTPDDDDDDDDEFAGDDDAGYSSLLGLTGNTVPQRTPVRMPEPDALPGEPVVIFPGQLVRDAAPGTPAPAPSPTRDSGATEEALRDALAKLQRLSGAA